MHVPDIVTCNVWSKGNSLDQTVLTEKGAFHMYKCENDRKIKSALLTEIKIEVNAEECNKTSF